MKAIVERTCCPTFLVAGGGPYMIVMGAVMTDIFIVQRLTDIMFLGDAAVYEDNRVFRVARMFTALKRGVDALITYYAPFNVKPYPAPDPNAGYFPYPNMYTDGDDTVKFRYVKALEEEEQCVTFLAETVTTGARVVVKFADRYGATPHRLLADQGMAPKLLYFGTLDGTTPVEDKCYLREGLHVGPLRMVVMEYVEGTTAAEVSAQWPKDVVEQVTAALTVLHEKKYVFGDLRLPNVMFSDGKVKLIDFNWAGKEEEARYPRLLSRAIAWPAEAFEFALIRAEHDLEMLQMYFATRV